MSTLLLNLPILLLAAAASINVIAQPAELASFMNGERSFYSSSNNLKSKGLDVSFEYPRMWGESDDAETKLPNTLYLVRSNGGRGTELCSLAITFIPNAAKVSEQEGAEQFSRLSLRDLVAAGAHYVDGARTTIDGQPAAWVQVEVEISARKLRGMMLSHFIYIDRRLITFSCSVVPISSRPEADTHKLYRMYSPLFVQIAKSVAINNKNMRRP